MTKYDDMNLDRHIGRIIPANPRMSIAEYFKDYRVKKSGKNYVVYTRRFLSEEWYKAMSFGATYKNIAKYLRDPRKKESILFVTNGMIDYGNMPVRSFGLVVSDKIENARNINRMVRDI